MTRTDMENNFVLQVKDISGILKDCKDSGVSSFKFGGLEVTFEKMFHVEQKIPDLTDKEHDEINRRGLLSEELRTKDDILAEMLIMDPLAAEELMMKDGSLKINDDESDDTGSDNDEII